MRMNPDVKNELQRFKMLIKNINKTLINQPKYIVDTLLDKRYNLTALKGSTQEPGISTQIKMERWSTLFTTLIQQLFS